MDELINKLVNISNLSEIENINSINSNNLLYAISKSGRYDLLKNANIKIDVNDRETLEKLVDYLLSDEDIYYYMNKNGFTFAKEEKVNMFNIVFEKYNYAYEFGQFFRCFFNDKDELNTYIKEHEQYFKEYISRKPQGGYSSFEECDKYVQLVLQENNVNLLNRLENYSISNLKLLAKFIERNNNIPYYLGDYRYAKHLFDLKDELDSNEFCSLLSLLRNKYNYEKEPYYNNPFSSLIENNIDYLIEVVSQTKDIPRCLVESTTFRDECIKKNRIDLASKCILPKDIINDDNLVNEYCKNLNINSKDFYERYKWLLDYSKNNDNIFNTCIATSLKDNIFNIDKEHYERFINDVSVQMSISKLDDKELMTLSKILDHYNYKDYDITRMVVNIINNIPNYKELINSIDIENVNEKDLKTLVSVLQFNDNKYQINNVYDLKNYNNLKEQFFEDNFNVNDLDSNKDNLLKVLFNIDLKEAQYIDRKYCRYNNKSNINDLPKHIYSYLELINKITDCNNKGDLVNLYNNLENKRVYNSEISLEPYLRSEYTELYSNSLYRINERNNVYGPKDNASIEVNYHDKNVKVCVPREKFNFLIHCLGSCSLKEDVIDDNYKNDWLYRPQLQDHFVACSYISEKNIGSIRSYGTIIFGFDSLENGSILVMADCDIDSIGFRANEYDGARKHQEENALCRFVTPREMLESTDNYNEIVIERRNVDKSKGKEFKRKPDYIIMMADSIEQENLNFVEMLYQKDLSFVSKEDQEEIKDLGDKSSIKKCLLKYRNVIEYNAKKDDIDFNNMLNKYNDLIIKAKYFEDCLKAASEFDIPLVLVDKKYYFNKILVDSNIYDEETIKKITETYKNADEYKKQNMYDAVSKGRDVTRLLQNKKQDFFTIAT